MVPGKILLRDWGLLALGAGLYTLAAPPYEWASVGWIALTPLFLVVREKPILSAFLAGLLYGILFCGGIAHWVYSAIAAYFPFTFPLDLTFTLLSYSFFVGTYTGFAAGLSCVLMRKANPLLCRISIPAVWVVGEFARSSLFAGFSWELLGYTQYRHLPLIQIADLTGVYGVSFLLAFSGYVAAEVFSLQFSPRPCFHSSSCISSSPWAALVSLMAITTGVWGYGAFRLQERNVSTNLNSSINVALVQGDIPHIRRWNRIHYASTLFHYARLTSQGLNGRQADLVIWPEFAVGFYLDRELALRRQIGQFTKQLNTALLLGAPRVEVVPTGERYYNSAYLLAPGGAMLEVYDKIRLLPFAEYRPVVLQALVPHSPEHPSFFAPGQRSTVFPFSKGSFGVLICYEATYPHLARRLVENGAQFLVNISNDTWLAGETAAVQHFSMSVFRAIENRRHLARTATAGIAAIVDPYGYSSHLSHTKDEVTFGRIIPQRHITVYTRYGDWFILACAGVVLLALGIPKNMERNN